MGCSMSMADTVILVVGVTILVTSLTAAVIHLAVRVTSLKRELTRELTLRKLAEDRVGEEQRNRWAAERRLAVARRRQPLDEEVVEGLQAALAGLQNYVLGNQAAAQQQQPPAGNGGGQEQQPPAGNGGGQEQQPPAGNGGGQPEPEIQEDEGDQNHQAAMQALQQIAFILNNLLA